MKKNIYELLNEVTVDINGYDDVILHKDELQIMKSNFRKSIKRNRSYKKVFPLAAAVVLTAIIIGTPLASYAYERADNIVYHIANFLGIEKHLDDYTTVINQAVTKQGITIQLNEVILDNEQLVVSTTASSNEKIENGYIGMNSTIFVNGTRIKSGAGGSSRPIDEYAVEEVMNHQLDSIDLSGDLRVKIEFPCIEVNGDKKEGPWIFEFKTNGDELAKNTNEIQLGNSFTLVNGQKITLEKYTSNDLGQKIFYFKDGKGTFYDMALKGRDNLGNKIEFYMSHEKDGKGIFKIDTINGNLHKDASALILTPYAVKLPDESGKMSNEFKMVGKEFIINLRK